MERNKDLKQTIEQVFGDYARESKRELERSRRISRFRNIKGAMTSVKWLVEEILERGILMEKAIPAYYFLGGFGNESMEHPNYEVWRENSIHAMKNLIELGGYR